MATIRKQYYFITFGITKEQITYLIQKKRGTNKVYLLYTMFTNTSNTNNNNSTTSFNQSSASGIALPECRNNTAPSKKNTSALRMNLSMKVLK